MAPTILSKNSDLARLAQILLAGAGSDELLAKASLEDVRAIKADTGVMHYRSTVIGRVASPEDQADAAARKYRFVASEESPDRMGDIIRVAGWNFANFKANPIALSNHDHECPVGTVSDMVKATGEKPQRLYESITFPSAGASPDADVTRALVDEGVLKAVSVGFLPEVVKWPESEDERLSLGVGRFGVVYEKQEQLELSVCSIPCHPSALITPKGKSIHRSQLARAVKQLVRDGKIEQGAADEFLARCGWSVKSLFPVTRVLRAERAFAEVSGTIEAIQGEPVTLSTFDAPPPLLRTTEHLAIEALLVRVDAADKRSGELSAKVEKLERELREVRASKSVRESREGFYEALDETAILAALDRKLMQEETAL